MDGWVTIGTKLDSKQLDKDIRSAESQLRQYEKEAERLTKAEAKAEVDLKDYYEKKQLIQEMTDKSLEYAQTEQEVNHILELEEINLQQLNDAYSEQLSTLGQVKQKIQENAHNQGLVTNNIKEMTAELNKTKAFENVNKSIDKVGNSVGKVTKKISRWAFALIGIRSIYMGIRRAINLVSERSEYVSGNMEAMKNVIANSLIPLVTAIINLMAKLMLYVNYITKALFGKAIFDFSKATQGASKNLKSGAKSAKEINKQLAGFDEMEVIGDKSSSGGGGGVDNLKGFDPKIFEGEIPKWLKWLVKHKKEILAIMAGVTAGLLAWKLGLGGIKALGIGILVTGLVYAIQSLIDYLKDPSFKNFGKIIQGIGVALLGLAVIVGSVPLAITSAVVLIVGTIIKYWEEIKKFLLSGLEWLKGKAGWIGDIFIGMIENVINFFDILFTSIKKIFDGIITFIKGVFTGNWKQAWEGLKQILKGFLDIFLGLFKLLFDNIKSIFTGIAGAIWSILKGIWDKIYAGIKRVIDGVKQIFSGDLIGGLKNIFGGLADILLAPFNYFKQKAGEIIDRVLGWYEKAKTKLEELLGLQTKYNNKASGTGKGGGVSGGGGSGGGSGSGGGFAKGGVVYHKLPKLAPGGIINQPGRGVPLGSAIGGERGAEGVIPLTDSQQMALLGEAIGRYISINATVPVYVGNRQIARELKKIEAEDAFAYNR